MVPGIIDRWFGRSGKSGEEFYKECMNRGVGKAEEKKFKEAISEFTKAISSMPDFADAYYARGLAYVNLEEWEKAIADFTEAIDKWPRKLNPYLTVFRFYLDRAIAFCKKGEYDKAEADLAKVPETTPSSRKRYWLLVCRYRGDTDRAFKEWAGR